MPMQRPGPASNSQYSPAAQWALDAQARGSAVRGGTAQASGEPGSWQRPVA